MVVIPPHASDLGWGLAKGLYQKNAPPAMRLEPMFLDRRSNIFTSWAILAPYLNQEVTIY